MHQLFAPLISLFFVASGVLLLTYDFNTANNSPPASSQYRQPAHLQEPVLSISSPATVNKRVLLLTVNEGDSLSGLFKKNGLDTTQAFQITQTEAGKHFTHLIPGQILRTTHSQTDNHVHAIEVELFNATLVRAVYQDGHYVSVIEDIPTLQSDVFREFTIEQSLQRSALNAGLPDEIISSITEAFASEIDFALDIRKGDRVAVLYSTSSYRGKKAAPAKLMSIVFFNNGRLFEAYQYRNGEQHFYLTRDGLSLKRKFLRAPLDFRRVSSKFNPNRLHPIFKTQRPHNGIDYAAPEGTAVLASGDGVVRFAGNQNGYGITIELDHGYQYSTLYAHLNRVAAGIKQDGAVEQGDVIGYVGQTGWATGPHLHYEFRIQGQHKNPSTVTIPYDAPLSKDELMTYLGSIEGKRATLLNHLSPFLASRINQ